MPVDESALNGYIGIQCEKKAQWLMSARISRILSVEHRQNERTTDKMNWQKRAHQQHQQQQQKTKPEQKDCVKYTPANSIYALQSAAIGKRRIGDLVVSSFAWVFSEIWMHDQ